MSDWVFVNMTDNLYADVQPAGQPKKFIPQVTSTFIHFVFKIFACIYLLVPGFGRIFMIRHTENQQREASSHHHLEDSGTREESKESAVDPLWKRLQNLEVMVTELTNKPSKIPLEKEDMLHESLNRIKSIEYDLQKTKRVRKFFHNNSNAEIVKYVLLTDEFIFL